MKALKIIGIILLIVVVLLLIIALFLPKDVYVESKMTINTPANTIFKQVNSMSNWSHWSPFDDEEDDYEMLYEGEKTGVGSIQRWVGKEGDGGTAEIIESVPYKEIKTEMIFMEEDKAYGHWTFEEYPDSTVVTWGIDFLDLSYPLGRYQGLLMQSMMNFYFEEGLKGLKEYAESLPPYPEITKKTFEAQPSVTVMDTAYFNDMSAKMGEMFGILEKFAKVKRLEMSGYPFAVYYDYNMEEGWTVVRCGIPIGKEVKGKGPVEFFTLGPAEVLFCVHKGSYQTLDATYTALIEYMEEYGLEPAGPSYEVYVTDPTTETDTTKWITNVYFPVK